MRNRHLLCWPLVVVLALGVLVSSGCAKKVVQAQDLRVAVQEEPRTFNTLLDPGAEGHMVAAQMYESLFGLDPEGNVVPVLATSYEQTETNVFEFTLRQRVKFHDGTTFNADDVVYTFNRVLDKNTGSVQWAMYGAYIDKVEKLADDKVKITLKKPWPDFLTILATKPYTYIASRTAVEQLGADYGVNTAVGTGPFKLAEWSKGQYVKLVKNTDYWDKQYPKLDSITYKIIPESSSRQIALKTGDVDMLFDVPYKDVAELAKDPEFTVARHGSGAAQELWLNTTKAPFDDKHVRQALDLAINKQQMVDTLFYGCGTVANSIFPNWHWAYSPDLKSTYDPEMAKALLAAAGYTKANPLKFTIITVPVPDYHDQAIMIQADLQEIGVEAQIQAMEKAAMVAERDAGNWTAIMYRLIWDAPILDYTWRPYGAGSYLNQPHYNQEGGFQNSEAESVLQEALVEYDQAKAKPLFAQFDKMIAEDVPKVKLSYVDNINAMHSYVKGYTTWIMDIVPMKATYIEKK